MNPLHQFRASLPRAERESLCALLETAFSGGPDLWARIMGGMPRPAKSAYRVELGIPRYYLKDVGGGVMIQEHILRSLFLTNRKQATERATS